MSMLTARRRARKADAFADPVAHSDLTTSQYRTTRMGALPSMLKRTSTAAASEPQPGRMLLVSRVSAILRALEDKPVGLSLAQIAVSVGLPRPTVQRLVDALKVEDLLAADTTNGGVRLGPGLVRLAASVKMDVPELARRHIEKLGRAVNETVVMSILRDGEANVLIQIPANRDIRLTIEISAAWQLHTTADGLALLEGLPENVIHAQFLKSKKLRRGSRPVSFKDFLRELDVAASAGFAIDRERTTDGICAIATGLKGVDGERYSISIIAPPNRFESNLASLRQELLKCGAAITAAAGASRKKDFR